MNLVDSLFESINFTFQDNSGKANKLSLEDESDKFCSKSIRPKKLLKVAKSTQNWQKYTGFDIISIAIEYLISFRKILIDVNNFDIFSEKI